MSPVGGNTETTRGAQALAAFKLAASIWGAAIDSPVTIEVAARFGPLACTAATGILGAGAPHAWMKNTSGARPNVLYPVALANRLAGTDLDTTAPDIDAVFNGAAGTTGCLEGSGWYFGLDRNSGNLTDLVTVVVHELGHGLGMTTPIDLDTGALRDGVPDVFSLFVVDERTGKHWSDMTDSARAESARAFHQLSWGGGNVTTAAATLLTHGMPTLSLGVPLDTLDPAIAVATFGPALTATPALGVLTAVADDTASPTDACGTSASLTGKVAFVEAGGCPDVDKVLSVQAAGAMAAILVSDQTTFAPLAPTGDDGGKATIPSVRIDQKDATTIRAALPQAPSARLWANPARALGTSLAGRVYLDAVDPVVPRVSVVHWDPIISPHLLMQPAIVTTRDLDLTVPLLEDLGWAAAGAVAGKDGGSGGSGGSTGSGGAGGSSGTGADTDAGLDGAITDASGGYMPDHLGSTTDGPPPANRFVDSGSHGSIGPGGIVWVPHSKGCDCRVGARTGAGSPAGVFGVALALLAFTRRRRAAR
ncbi:MAG TPA: PA domain-containing protein [Polyangiaceae bacterium]|nr:PA domain-containing protein [Polyangiaceae bacterium]